MGCNHRVHQDGRNKDHLIQDSVLGIQDTKDIKDIFRDPQDLMEDQDGFKEEPQDGSSTPTTKEAQEEGGRKDSRAKKKAKKKGRKQILQDDKKANIAMTLEDKQRKSCQWSWLTRTKIFMRIYKKKNNTKPCCIRQIPSSQRKHHAQKAID